MEVRAIAKSIRISPRKVRLVADTVRNLPVEDALHVLEAAEKRAALPIAKTIKSAVANATNNAKLEKANLTIGSIQIADGQPLKRFHPSTRGRIHPYKKRSSHIIVVLKEKVMSVTKVAPASDKAVAGQPAASASERADAAVAAALHGGTEEKKGGVRGLAARLTGKKVKKEDNKNETNTGKEKKTGK